ncbi:hypothetical protein [Vibrio sagamiensis]|uniref:hypothetical protein n=1 Tax=Vibrio sagamiensis TaxID=512650 RepID=UPI00039DF3E8|nr:hypothetical protein [Vibrio sagamiensis]
MNIETKLALSFLSNPEFIFDPSCILKTGLEKDDGEFSEQQRTLISEVRLLFP